MASDLQWPLATRLRHGRTNGTYLQWAVTEIHREAADRIEELEAEVERLVAASGDSMVHEHFARVVTERNEARAEVERLRLEPRLALLRRERDEAQAQVERLTARVTELEARLADGGPTTAADWEHVKNDPNFDWRIWERRARAALAGEGNEDE
jgi:multidrug resistance efflux pump